MDLHWWSARVSSVSGEVLSVHDWVNDVNSFNIYPIGVNDPAGIPPPSPPVAFVACFIFSQF